MSAFSELQVEIDGQVVTLEVKDALAREAIAQIGDALYWMGVTSTVITDGSTTNPIVIPDKYIPVADPTGEDPAANGWYEYDDATTSYVLTQDTTPVQGKTYYTTTILAKLGGMAQYSGEEFVWNGTAWQSVGKNNFGSLAFKNSASGSYTPAGSVSITPGADTTDTVPNVTGVGALPSMTLSGETLIFNAGSLPTLGEAKTVLKARGADTAAFSGSAATISVS